MNRIKRKKKVKEPTTAMTSVINEFNYDRLFELVEFAKRLELEPLSFRLLQDPCPNCAFPEEEQIPGLVEDLEELLESDFSVEFEFSLEDLRKYYESGEKNLSEDKKEPHCYFPFFELAIFADGTVGPCCVFNEEGNTFSSQIRDKKLNDIWPGSKLEYLRVSNFLNELPRVCKDCPLSDKERRSFGDEFNDIYNQLSKSGIRKKIREHLKVLKNELS